MRIAGGEVEHCRALSIHNFAPMQKEESPYMREPIRRQGDISEKKTVANSQTTHGNQQKHNHPDWMTSTVSGTPVMITTAKLHGMLARTLRLRPDRSVLRDGFWRMPITLRVLYPVVFAAADGPDIDQDAYLKAITPDASEGFGFAVAVDDDTMVVGSSGDASAATGAHSDSTDSSAQGAGAASMFARNGAGTWSSFGHGWTSSP